MSAEIHTVEITFSVPDHDGGLPENLTVSDVCNHFVSDLNEFIEKWTSLHKGLFEWTPYV